MKNLYVGLIATVAFLLFVPVSTLGGGVPWSEPINIPGERFIVLESYNNQAVFDKETGLVWEQSPDSASRQWLAAQVHCNQKTVGNRKGWRPPTVQELASLVDPTVAPPGPTLPAGHPFINVQSGGQFDFYWAANTRDSFPNLAWTVRFTDGVVSTRPKTDSRFVWCVRGGQGVDPQ